MKVSIKMSAGRQDQRDTEPADIILTFEFASLQHALVLIDLFMKGHQDSDVDSILVLP